MVGNKIHRHPEKKLKKKVLYACLGCIHQADAQTYKNA
jgi:hypothetical protein